MLTPEPLSSNSPGLQFAKEMMARPSDEWNVYKIARVAEALIATESTIRSLTYALEAEKKRREGAPHAKTCAVSEWELRMWAYGQGVRKIKHPGEKPPCNCWKAEEKTNVPLAD